MGWFRRFILGLSSPKTGEAIEKESRNWMVQCPCGHERSVWEMGGIRSGASGNKKIYVRCDKCQKRHWNTVYYKEPANPKTEG